MPEHYGQELPQKGGVIRSNVKYRMRVAAHGHWYDADSGAVGGGRDPQRIAYFFDDVKTAISEDIVSVTISREVDSPIGTFSVMLKPRHDYLRRGSAYRLRPNDYVRLEEYDIHTSTWVPMLDGLIDGIEYNKASMDSGGISIGISVHGSSIGKVLPKTSLYFADAPYILPGLNFAGINMANQFSAMFKLEKGATGETKDNRTVRLRFAAGVQLYDALSWFIKLLSSLKVETKGVNVSGLGKRPTHLPASMIPWAAPSGFPFPPRWANTGGARIADGLHVMARSQGDGRINVQPGAVDTNQFAYQQSIGYIADSGNLQVQGQLAGDAMFYPAGDIWSTCQQFGVPQLHEMSFEMLPTVVDASQWQESFIFRRRPYKPYDMEMLGTYGRTMQGEKLKANNAQDILKAALSGVHFVDPQETVEEHVGLSDAETKNMVAVRAENSMIGMQYQLTPQGIMPYLDLDSIRTHGIRFANISVNSLLDNEQQILKKILHDYSEELLKWWGSSQELMSGTIVLRDRPFIRAGDILVLMNPRKEIYYIQGVNRQWTYGSASTVTLTVTRGYTMEGEGLFGSLDTDSERKP